jgi:ferric-dicitrate binding protein FerR (iron transport regulator)
MGDLFAKFRTSQVAAEWFIRATADDLSKKEKLEFVNWARQSPKHVAELLRVYRMFGLFRCLSIDSLPLSANAQSPRDESDEEENSASRR